MGYGSMLEEVRNNVQVTIPKCNLERGPSPPMVMPSIIVPCFDGPQIPAIQHR